MSDVPRSLQSWVSTIHTVVLTADVFQLFVKTCYKILRRMGKNKAWGLCILRRKPQFPTRRHPAHPTSSSVWADSSPSRDTTGFIYKLETQRKEPGTRPIRCFAVSLHTLACFIVFFSWETEAQQRDHVHTMCTCWYFPRSQTPAPFTTFFAPSGGLRLRPWWAYSWLVGELRMACGRAT